MKTITDSDWAVLRTGGKQYRVRVGDIIKIERANFFSAASFESGTTQQFVFDDILAVGGAERVVLGRPTVLGARVSAELVTELREKKVIVLKKRRRKNSHKKRGHRQTVQQIKIAAIWSGDEQPNSGLEYGRPSIRPEAELRSTLSSLYLNLRSGQSDAINAAFEYINQTNWLVVDEPTRCVVAREVKPLIASPVSTVRRSAVQALSHLGLAVKASSANKALEHVGDLFTENYADQLSVIIDYSAMPSVSFREDTGIALSRHRVRVTLALEYTTIWTHVASAVKDDIMRVAEISVVGEGVGTGSVRLNWRRKPPLRVLGDAVIEFTNDERVATFAKLDILLSGRRIARKFLDLKNGVVARDKIPAELPIVFETGL